MGERVCRVGVGSGGLRGGGSGQSDEGDCHLLLLVRVYAQSGS